MKYATVTSFCRDLTTKYCKGNGVDIGSGGDPVVPSAIQIELPRDESQVYTLNRDYEILPQWRGNGLRLPFKDEILDFVYSSHLIEDYEDWHPILTEWTRVLKNGGNLVIMLPDKGRFQAAIARGGHGNANHKHESFLGELSGLAADYDLYTVEERFTRLGNTNADWNILFVGKKIRNIRQTGQFEI